MKLKTALKLGLGTAAVLGIAGYAEVRYVLGRSRNIDLMKNPPVTHDQIKYREVSVQARRDLESRKWKTVTIRSADGLRLVGKFLPKKDARGTVLLAHGYRSMSEVDFSMITMWFYDLGFNVLRITQRAHGKSEGRYIGFGTLERGDVALWAHRINDLVPERLPIVLVGLSMGATSVLLATGMTLPENVRGVIADCGFTNCGEIIRKVMRDMHLPVPLLYPIFRPACRFFAGFDPDKVSTVDAMRRCRLPVLFVHGTGDDFVPCEMTVRAYRACRSDKELLTVEGASHGYSYPIDTEAYQAAVHRLLCKCGLE